MLKGAGPLSPSLRSVAHPINARAEPGAISAALGCYPLPSSFLLLPPRYTRGRQPLRGQSTRQRMSGHRKASSSLSIRGERLFRPAPCQQARLWAAVGKGGQGVINRLSDFHPCPSRSGLAQMSMAVHQAKASTAAMNKN